MPVDISKELPFIRQLPGFGQYLARVLDNIVQGVNNFGSNVNADSTSTLPAPGPIQQLTVKTDGNGTVHAVINDSAALQKNTSYFLEYSTNSSFVGAYVKHMGPSRTADPFQLPAFDDNGNAQSWHFRAYKQSQGSKPGPPVNFGGAAPTPVSVGGTQKLTLLPSTGSGTGSPTGTTPGVGFGTTLYRQSQGPKRRSVTPGTG
jgi:hypothetical protein